MICHWITFKLISPLPVQSSRGKVRSRQRLCVPKNRNPFPWMAGWCRTNCSPNSSRRCCNCLHNSRHSSGPLPLCWKDWFLQPTWQLRGGRRSWKAPNLSPLLHGASSYSSLSRFHHSFRHHRARGGALTQEETGCDNPKRFKCEKVCRFAWVPKYARDGQGKNTWIRPGTFLWAFWFQFG